jgi:hypothetical protein
MRRFQTISEFSHGLGRLETLVRGRGRSIISTSREWLHRVDFGQSALRRDAEMRTLFSGRSWLPPRGGIRAIGPQGDSSSTEVADRGYKPVARSARET